MKAVADQFAETLAAVGVKRSCGIPGDGLNGLTDAIRRHGKIEWVHVRHEEVAAFAAGAEAYLTGELVTHALRVRSSNGRCIGTSLISAAPGPIRADSCQGQV